jgi:hypothetical protein
MSVLKKLSVILIVFSIDSAAFARDVTGKIVDLITWSDGHSFIKIENGPINGCSSQYFYSLGVKGQDVKAENMLSVALAAYMGNRNVHLVTADGSCQGGQEKIVAIQLLPN